MPLSETVANGDFYVQGMAGGTDNTDPTCNDVDLGATPHDHATGGSANCQDADGDALTYAKAGTDAAHGTATVAADGSIGYTPSPGYVGSDTFHYRATDAYGGASAIKAVTVTVTNQPPVCSAVAGQQVAQDTPKDITISCTDVENDAYTLALGATAPSKGTVTFTQSTHTVTYTPQAGATGPDAFDLVASDGYGGASPAIPISITIAPSAPSGSSPDAGSSPVTGSSPDNGTSEVPETSQVSEQPPAPTSLQALASRVSVALAKAARRVDPKKGLALGRFTASSCPRGCLIRVLLRTASGRTIGMARLVVPPGGPLTVKLNRAGRKLLAKSKRVRAAARLELRDTATGATTTVTKKVTLVPRKR